jgi:hypothetical protein
MRCNRRSFVFYDVVVLFIIILLVLSATMNDCGFSRWSYQVFHLPCIAAMSVDLTIPILFPNLIRLCPHLHLAACL